MTAKKLEKVFSRYVILSLIGSFVIMALFGFIASENPDGLERTFEAIGVEEAESGFLSLEFLGKGLWGDIISMAIGMILVLGIMLVVSKLLSAKSGVSLE